MADNDKDPILDFYVKELNLEKVVWIKEYEGLPTHFVHRTKETDLMYDAVVKPGVYFIGKDFKLRKFTLINIGLKYE